MATCTPAGPDFAPKRHGQHEQKRSMNPDSFFAHLPAPQRKIARALRALIRELVPEIAESVLWRSLSYHRPKIGGRVKGAVCLVTPKAGAVELAFIHGAALADPAHVLRGTRRSKRFLPIRDMAEVDKQVLVDLIKAAAQYVPNRR